MSRVEQIENQVRELSPEELHTFRDWFAEYDAARWDEQFEEDAISGRLDRLTEAALRDHDLGLSSKL